MRPLVFNLGAADRLFSGLVERLHAESGRVTLHRFPDGESLVRVHDTCDARQTIIVCSLDRPDAKIVPLLLAAETLRDLGAHEVGLVAPYLAYMRQDSRFQPGEGISGRYFAQLLSNHFYWLVTVDPHLHRVQRLEEIFAIATRTVHTAALLANWVGKNVTNPVLIGPDTESKQWVAEVARLSGAPYLILEKIRSGDFDVDVSIPNIEKFQECTPVLVDDIISTGRTAVAVVRHLIALGSPPSVCLAVHGVFADRALALLQEAGASRIATCNTIEHRTNDIDVTPLLAEAVSLLTEPARPYTT